MGKVKVVDDLIVLDRIEQDEPLKRRLRALSSGTGIDLDVNGVVGRWERTVVDIEGQWRDALRAAGKVYPAPSAPPVEVRALPGSNNLATFGQRQLLWDIPGNQIH
jgi:hypothetical protein